MRKYKFRAWVDGQMLDDISTYTDDFTSMLNKTFAYLQEYENVKFMQFIGLLDKNGKEIYEGDILKYSDTDDTISVEFAEHLAHFVGYTNDKSEGCYPLAADIDLLEVIGNIYENPELLESK